MERTTGDERPKGEAAEGARGDGFRIFATWMRDEQGPLFCRWTEPGRRVAAAEGGD